jgi:DeoR/GlpR family transcriptional regulator of sugar metabolism
MRRSLSVIASLSEIHRIITDERAEPQTIALLRARGLDVLVV